MTSCQIGTSYQIGITPVNPVPVKGRYLSRTFKGLHADAFVGADLHSGRSVLVEPSLAQCAQIVGATPCEVWWAVKRQELRPEILAGVLPLVPPRARANGTTLPSVNGAAIDFDRLVATAKTVGADAWLAAGAAAGLK